ncbi:hypothetical protein RJT34_17768 [Clitoria ternatea]|uniref:DUF7356 domain-containing protein n=1 Tax=Clitoria ternatea TaxID=43366 RepID=A0AAN9JB37_CLITE
MGRHMLLPLLLLSLVVFDSSEASFVWELRKLVASDLKDNKPQDSHPNPVGETNKGQKGSPSTSTDKDATVSPSPQPLTNVLHENDGKKGGNDENNNSGSSSVPPLSVPPVPKKDAGSVVGDKDKKEENGNAGGIKFSHFTTNDTCNGLNSCTDERSLLACIAKIDSKYLVVLLQNRGDDTIKVKLRTDFENNIGALDVGKNKTEKVNIRRTSGKSTQLTLKAGKGECVLHMVPPIHKGNFFLRLPSFDKILTPVNGAYFLILTVLVFGGTWACCMFRKRRPDEVPYQELEMALPESVATEESAEGWDQGWDDDWDDNVAVKSPVGHHAGSISANGLTSRSSNKDGWENDWDD